MVNLGGSFVACISIFVHFSYFITSIPVSFPALSLLQQQRPDPRLRNHKYVPVPLGFLIC